MAQKIQTLFIDDLDGSDADGTVRFALDGTDYEIDLNETHREALRNTLEPYIAHARKLTGDRRSRRGGGRKAGGSGIDTAAARAWAREQGMEIKERGRVPASVVEQYRQATGR